MSSPKDKRISALKSQSFNIASVALRDAWTDFVLSRQALQCTARTLANYQWTLGKFIAWLENQGITSPDQITARHVRQYLALYANKSDWYLNGHARAIRTLLRFWHKEGYLPQPVTFDMPKVRQKRLPFLTADQVARVMKAADVREGAIVAFIVDSGLRRQEVVNLNRQDIDLKTGLVKVWQGKGKKDRISLIGATARRYLLRYWRTCPDQRPEAPAFQTKDGQRLTVYGLSALLARLSKKVGFRVSPHALRRTFATLALQNGMDLVSVQMLMGHADISTTRQYIQWLDSDLVAAHQKASPIDRLKQ